MSMSRSALSAVLALGLTSAVAACSSSSEPQAAPSPAAHVTTATAKASAKDAPVTAQGTTQAKGPGHAAPSRTHVAAPTSTTTDAGAPAGTATTAAPTDQPATDLPTAPSTLNITDPGPRPASSPAKPAPKPDHSKESAADFARYYVELLNYAWQKPDPAPLEAHAAPGCATCTPFIEVAKTFAMEKSHADRPVVVIASSTANDVVDGVGRQVLVIGRQLGFRSVGANGQVRSDSAARDIRLQVILVPAGDSWKVQDIQPIG